MKNQTKYIFIAQNLSYQGGIETLSRLIVANGLALEISSTFDLQRSVSAKNSDIKYGVTKIYRTLLLYIFVAKHPSHKILISHINALKLLFFLFPRREYLLLCHGSEVWKNSYLHKIHSKPNIRYIVT